MDSEKRQEANFDEGYQALLLLVGEPEATELFKVELQKALDETQRAVEFAMDEREIEAVRLHLPLLRKLLENQEKFLLDLREKLLAKLFPDQALPGQETLN